MIDQGKDLHDKLSASRQDALDSLLGHDGRSDGELKYKVIAQSCLNLDSVRARGDLTLRTGDRCDIVIEGVNSMATSESLYKTLQNLDPLAFGEEYRVMHIKRPLLTQSGDYAPTTTCAIDDFLITQGLQDFITGRTNCSTIPRSLYFRSEINRNYALEIRSTEELRHRFKILESLGWEKYQIEGAIRNGVVESLQRASALVDEPVVRMLTARRENAKLIQVPIHEAVIMVCFSSEQSLERMAALQVKLRMDVLAPALPPVTLLFTRWGTSDTATALTEARDIRQVSAARHEMSQFRPPQKVLCALQVEWKVEVTKKALQNQIMNKTVVKAEGVILEALGGVSRGVLGVLLSVDPVGRPNLRKARILVCDEAQGERERAEGIKRKLLEGYTLAKSEFIASIRATSVNIALVKEPEPMSVNTVAETIAQHLDKDPRSTLAVPRFLASGQAFPLTDDLGSGHEVSLDILGAMISDTHLDVRTLFSSMAQPPTLRQLAEALRLLASDRSIQAYGGTVANGSREVIAIHAALDDALAAPDPMRF